MRPSHLRLWATDDHSCMRPMPPVTHMHAACASPVPAPCPSHARPRFRNPPLHADFDETLPGTRLTNLLASTVTTLSHLAMHVHLLCALVFLLDLSLATAPFPLGSLLYALVRDPRPLYWRMLLVYTETLLLLEYVFQVSLQVGCLNLDVPSRDLARQLGLHESLVRPLPPPSPHTRATHAYAAATSSRTGARRTSGMCRFLLRSLLCTGSAAGNVALAHTDIGTRAWRCVLRGSADGPQCLSW